MKYYRIQDVVQINRHGSLERETYFIEEMNKRNGLDSSGWKFYRIYHNNALRNFVTLEKMLFYRASLK